jgi:membrane associated rhomboid family serine protease
VTLALMAVNLVVFLWTARLDASGAAAADAKLTRVAEWTLRLADQQAPGLVQRAGAYDSPLTFLERDPHWRREVQSAELRERLEACLEDAGRLRSGHPFYTYGFVPAEISLKRLLAHQFLHADVFHFGFNMLFLWAVGGLLELTLGAALFAPAYLLCGVVAALGHAAFHPGSTEPAVGASGAVAGAMGMFAVLHGRQPVRLAFVAMLALTPRIFFLSWPAYVFLGLWLLEQVFYASFGLASLGIAFWAHIAGFMCGMLLALGLRLTRGVPADA